MNNLQSCVAKQHIIFSLSLHDTECSCFHIVLRLCENGTHSVPYPLEGHGLIEEELTTELLRCSLSTPISISRLSRERNQMCISHRRKKSLSFLFSGNAGSDTCVVMNCQYMTTTSIFSIALRQAMHDVERIEGILFRQIV